MRPEGFRWRALNQAVPMATSMSPDIQYLLAPQLKSGSWFTVMPRDYWTSYVHSRLQQKLTVVDDKISSKFGDHSALVDYKMSPDGRSADVVVSRLGMSDGKAVVTQVGVTLARRNSAASSGHLFDLPGPGGVAPTQCPSANSRPCLAIPMHEHCAGLGPSRALRRSLTTA